MQKLLLYLLLSLLFVRTQAQQDSTATLPQPVAAGVFIVNPSAGQEPDKLFMGNCIGVKVNNLASLLAQSDTGSLVLYMNGIPMTDIRSDYTDIAEQTVYFTLIRSAGVDPWDVFYTSPFTFSKDHITVSVGFMGPGAIASSNCFIDLVIIRKGYFWLALLCILFVVGLFVYAAKRGMLRDICQQATAKLKPYSLSRTQLAIWTLIVAIAYIFIALVTGELAPLTTSTLLLLGISGATTAAAGVIDSNDINNHTPRHQDQSSQGFFNDILSDKNGVSVHRYQMVVFNAILMLFFIKEVFSELSMPSFDNNLLILMGISNGTYAGLKANENSQGAASATAAPAPQNNAGTPPTDGTVSGDDNMVPPVG